MKQTYNEKEFKKLNRAIKNREKQIKRKKAMQDVSQFVKDHPEVVVPVTVALLTTVKTVARITNRHVVLHKEQRLKDNYIYDRSLGHYWKLNRNLKNSEWKALDERKKNGESLVQILTDLKVLS